MGNYQFKKGRFCSHYGPANIIDNSNITDDMAKHFISKGILSKEYFNIKKTK